MEGSAAGVPSSSPAGVGGMSNTNEVTTPGAHDDDSRHTPFAITASSIPKTAGGIPQGQNQQSSGDGFFKDLKSVGTRFHEECHETDLPGPRLRSSRQFKGKGKEAVLVEREAKKPLRLLDLPMDILKEIVKEVTHTNDLTSLARCHSALHLLAIPHIYSRFDIVWPDSSTHAEPRSGVDALTYGLATLVMAEEIFEEAPGQRNERSNRFTPGGQGQGSAMTVRRRIGNHYAQFTRKFSLGNGPADWVQEYLITKEGGKMLGTLVALALARMQILETFIWDMPTGILRDVWLCLSSLGRGREGQPCKLEKVWVRWHDNSTAEPSNSLPPTMDGNVPPHAPLPPNLLSDLSLSPLNHPALDRVEHPSFSVLSPLKSLSVLDIDELQYLDEMAVLIGKSLDKLRELRVGIARHAAGNAWSSVWVGDQVQQVDHSYPTAGSVTIGEKRLGGVLGILTGFVCDMRKVKTPLPNQRQPSTKQDPPAPTPQQPLAMSPPIAESASLPDALVEQGNSLTSLTDLRDVLPDIPTTNLSPTNSQTQAMLYENDPLIATSSHGSSPMASSPLQTPKIPPGSARSIDLPDPLLSTHIEAAEGAPSTTATEEPAPQYLNNVLKLESLELERVQLSVPVLQKAIDWTRLTSLTLLHCQNHEQLWKTLRRTFAPTPRPSTYPHPRHNTTLSHSKRARFSVAGSDMELEYGLKLKKIHTNAVSPALISFLKDTLAPNSLETLFLQEARSFVSSVSVDHIYKGPLRRHRHSLKKLLIDSSEKGVDGLPIHTSNRWKRWMLNREILSFICSGKMPALRELGMAVDYRDWHFFLQHLPSIPHLRSLYIPFLAEHVHGANLDPRELALQIVDIVALRPEVELCYMGISNKCFEILENRLVNGRGEPQLDLGGGGPGGTGGGGGAHGHNHLHHGHSIDGGAGSDGEDDDDDDEDDDVVDGDDDEVVIEEVEDGMENGEDTESDPEDDSDDDDDDSDEDIDGEGALGAVRLRLREILFYDDKVAVFKARHGRL